MSLETLYQVTLSDNYWTNLSSGRERKRQREKWRVVPMYGHSIGNKQ